MNNDVYDLEGSDDTTGQEAVPEFTQTETVESASASRSRRRRWWVPSAALACVLAAVGAGVYAAHWSTQRHRDALSQQSYDLATIVTRKAGPGLDTAFDFSFDAKSGSLTLTSPTTFYVACASGQAVVGPFTPTCDGKLAVYGPYGTSGTVLRLSLPAAPWALVARPSDQGLAPTTPVPQSSAYR